MPSIACVEDALALDGEVVRLPHPVEVDVEEEAGRRLELVDLLADEHAVGAEVDDLLRARGSWRSARRSPDRSSARRRRSRRPGRRTRRRVEALLDRELLLDRRFVLADPAAAGAGQVAGVERLEHQDHREPLRSGVSFFWRRSRRSGASSAAGSAVPSRPPWSGLAGRPDRGARSVRAERADLGRRSRGSDVERPRLGRDPAGQGRRGRDRLTVARRRPAVPAQSAISGK